MRRILSHGILALLCVVMLNCGKSSPTGPSDPATGGGSAGGGGSTGGGGGGVLEPVVFTDGDFDDNQWDVVVQVLGAGGTGSAGHLQSGGVGNSDYRRTIIDVNAAQGATAQVAVFSIKRAASYFPSDGAVTSIDYSEDSLSLTPGTNGQASAPALRQNGVLYLLVPGGGAFDTPDPLWGNHSVNGRAQNDFRTLDNASSHPNFSTSGGKIEFGFVRLHSVPPGGGAETRRGGIDNWRVTLRR